MVEGGKIDWACHGNDAATVFNEVKDMDDAIKVAYEFYKKHPKETLIVVTADHETGGIVLGTGKYALNLKALQYQKHSADGLSRRISELRKSKGNKVTWEDMKEFLVKKWASGNSSLFPGNRKRSCVTSSNNPLSEIKWYLPKACTLKASRWLHALKK